MKKVLMMIALLAIPFAMQAQSKFHDVEAHDAKGPVKSITVTMMGMSRTTNFTEDGKMVPSGEVTDPVYDANGYLQSAKISFQGQSSQIKYIWENGQLKGQSMQMMGQEIITTHNYDANGNVTSETMNMGGQKIDVPYTDIKYDDHGNWISRKSSAMGQEMVSTRTIEYY